MDSSTSKCTSTNTELGYWQDLDYSDKVEHLFTTGHAADCKFIVGAEYETAEVIHGHKFMFRLVSPVFERMFDSHFVETHHSTEIRLRDVEPQDFKNFRFMIYNNSEANLSQLSFADIVKVYKLCDQYMIKSISENCMTHIWKLLEAMAIDNLIIIFGFACYLEDVRLLEAVKEKIKLSKEKIAATVNDLNEHSFYDYIIYLNVLEVNAVTLLNVINSYFVSNNLLPIEELEDEEIIVKVEEKVEEKEKEPLVKVVCDDNSPPDENVVPEPAPVDLKVVEPINDDEVLRPKTKNSLLNNLFLLINFTTMTPAEFADGPGKLQILSVKKNYSDKVEHLFTTGHAADCKFIVGAEYETAEVIHGHKFMFRLVSPVFERMFDSHFVETHHSTEIRLRDVEPQDFKNFRFMIYNNSEANLSQLSFADIVKVYKLCDQYMIKSISENCMTHIWKLLEAMAIDNLIIIFGFACYLEDVRLLEAVKEKIKLSKEKIAATVNDLNEHSFYDYIIYLNVLEVNAVTLLNVINSYFVSNNLLPIEELEDEEIIVKVEEKVEEKEKEPLVKVVCDDNSPPDENVVPEPAPVDLKVVEPINDDEVLRPKTKNSLLNNLFLLINFTTMTPAEFADGPGKLQILSVKKKYEILSFLCTKNK